MFWFENNDNASHKNNEILLSLYLDYPGNIGKEREKTS